MGAEVTFRGSRLVGSAFSTPIASGGGAPFPGMQKHRFPQVSNTSNLALGSPSQAATPSIAWCGACCASRAADGGCAGAADGSSAAALALVAAVAEHPHTQVAARPLNAPTAKPHATLQLSPATVTADGLPRHPFADQQSADAMACTRPSRSCRSRTACLSS